MTILIFLSSSSFSDKLCILFETKLRIISFVILNLVRNLEILKQVQDDDKAVRDDIGRALHLLFEEYFICKIRKNSSQII